MIQKEFVRVQEARFVKYGTRMSEGETAAFVLSPADEVPMLLAEVFEHAVVNCPLRTRTSHTLHPTQLDLTDRVIKRCLLDYNKGSCSAWVRSVEQKTRGLRCFKTSLFAWRAPQDVVEECFPVHDDKFSQWLMANYTMSMLPPGLKGKAQLQGDEIVDEIRLHYGESVGIYFAYMRL